MLVRLSIHSPNFRLRIATLPWCTRCEAYRNMSNVSGEKTKDSANFRRKSSDSQKKERPKREKGQVFCAWPPAQLKHPVLSPSSKFLDLPIFGPEVVDESMIGRAAIFSSQDNDPLRVFGLPKKIFMEFRILSKPYSIVRDVTVTTVGMLRSARRASSRDSRAVFTGRAGCGKSFLLLQAVKHCIADGWIVVYIPRGVNLVNSTVAYEYDLRTRTYVQPTVSHQILWRLQTVNRVALTGLTTTKKLVFGKREIPAGMSLFELVGFATKDPSVSPVVLDALMSELSSQSKYPVLLAVDDFQSVFCQTAYRDPHFSRIRPYHLSVPRLILDFASGRRSFAKGAFLGALTASDSNYKTPLQLAEALGLPHDQPPSPYNRGSRTLMEYIYGLTPIRVPEQLSIQEAASLFELWMNEKALSPSCYDEMFLAKYTESSGNARDFVWDGLLSSLES